MVASGFGLYSRLAHRSHRSGPENISYKPLQVEVVIPNWIPGTNWIQRNFSLVSGAIIGIQLAIILFLVVFYVPAADRSTLWASVLTIAGVLLFISSTLAAFITIDNRLQLTRFVREEIRNDNSSGIAAAAESFMQTDEDRLEEAMEDLSDWFIVRENEEIILDPESNLSGGDRYYMLYVFACRVASELDQRNSSRVSKNELMKYLDISPGQASVFMDKMDYWVEIYYRKENSGDSGDFHLFDEDEQTLLGRIDPDDLVVELNDRYALEVVEYIRGEQNPPN